MADTTPPTGWKHAAAVCWFLLYAVASTWPLVLNLDTHIPGTGPGDNVAFLWNFWWFRYATFNPDAQLFYTHHLFAPGGVSLVLHTHTALPALFGATLLRPLTVSQAHNIVLLAGLAANGVATYALAWHVVRRSGPALLAGTVFAGSAYVSIHLLGHFNLVHAWVLPLAALDWTRFMEAPTMRRGAAVGVALAIATYTDYYYFVYAVLFAAISFAAVAFPLAIRWETRRVARIERWLIAAMTLAGVVIVVVLVTGGFQFNVGPLRISASHVRNPLAALWLVGIVWLVSRVRVSVRPSRAQPTWKQHAPALALGLLVMAILTLPLSLGAVQMMLAGDYVPAPHTWRSGPRGIDLLTMVLGNPLHGQIAPRVYARLGIDMMEQVAWIGIAPVIILILALRRRPHLGEESRAWIWIAVFFFVWSCGAYLTIAGIDTGLPLPQALARFIPIVSNARMPGRAFVAVQLAAAVLCAIAVARMGWKGVAIAGLVALAVADGAVARPMYKLPGADSVDKAIAEGALHQAVVELPLGVRDGFGEEGRFDHRALVHQVAHERPLAGGFVARLPDRIRRNYNDTTALASLMRASVGPTDLPADLSARLLELGISHLVVNADVMPAGTRDLLAARGFRLVLVDGTRELYLAGGAP